MKESTIMKIAQWYNNFQAPSVLMIDDLSDAYINVYDESYKNDWGYLCDTDGSSFDFLQKHLLNHFPYIKITFFVPYLRHNVINQNSKFDVEKYALGERDEYTVFLKNLVKQGHEISHHGSDHGRYIDNRKVSTAKNFIHEWALFKDIETGVEITLNGVKKFKEYVNIEVVGGKYCGYRSIDNSSDIIDQCNFLYWCEKVNYLVKDYSTYYFGRNDIISFPTNFSGNSFVRLSYMTGHSKRDKKKKFLKFFQPIYNLVSYYKLLKLYQKRHIISIQEHISPSTTAGTVQSANVITDIRSLQKIYKYLHKLSIWYASCQDIASYVSIRDNSTIVLKGDKLIIEFLDKKNIKTTILSITNKHKFSLIDNTNKVFRSSKNNNLYVINISINPGKNTYKIGEV